MAKARIHIEHAIKCLKRFPIFQSVVPLTLKDILDDMVFVCTALTNLLPPLIYWLGQSQHLSGHQYQHTALIQLESDDLTPLMSTCHAEGQFQDKNLQNVG